MANLPDEASEFSQNKSQGGADVCPARDGAYDPMGVKLGVAGPGE
jgi:hypothetical protein